MQEEAKEINIKVSFNHDINEANFILAPQSAQNMNEIYAAQLEERIGAEIIKYREKAELAVNISQNSERKINSFERTIEDCKNTSNAATASVLELENALVNYVQNDLSNLSNSGEEKVEAQKAYLTGNVLTDTKGYNKLLALKNESTESGIDTYNEIEIQYVLSKTGSKIVSANYRTQVQNIYEEKGVSPYYTLDEENQNYTLPMGEVYGMITKKADADLSNIPNSAKIFLAHCAMPSSKFVSLTPVMGASGNYTAPASGYFQVSAKASSGGQTLQISGGGLADTRVSQATTQTLQSFILARKGATISTWITSGMTNASVKFCYANGSESEGE